MGDVQSLNIRAKIASRPDRNDDKNKMWPLNKSIGNSAKGETTGIGESILEKRRPEDSSGTPQMRIETRVIKLV